MFFFLSCIQLLKLQVFSIIINALNFLFESTDLHEEKIVFFLFFNKRCMGSRYTESTLMYLSMLVVTLLFFFGKYEFKRVLYDRN